ncbi:membrane protein [Candidatus Nitromaritima sp. SCGC AAA799-C22]|nr:membrane protein [Candidatus Nitromaritima sp. SCGC AAA799-C22]
MENRLLLAFILSLAVFVGWGYLVAVIQGPPPQKVESEKELAEKVPPTGKGAVQQPPSGMETRTPAEPSTPPAPEEIPLAPEFPGEETTIRVSTGRATYIITNKGAMIQNILLPQYKTDEGEAIDLVQHEDDGLLPLALESSDKQITHILQNAFYQPSVSSLDLSESQPTGQLKLTLQHNSGLTVVRELTFHHNEFAVDVQTRINAPAYASKNLAYEVIFGPSLGGKTESQTNYIVFVGPTTFVNNERMETSPEDITDEVVYRGDLAWTSFQNKYFAAALIPQDGIKSAVVKKSGENIYVGLKLESVQSSASASHVLYAGTKELQVLEKTGYKLVRLLDYGWLGNKFAFLVKPLLKVLQYFHDVFNNYGWAIIVLTVIIKIIFFPLTHKSFKSMKGMQKVQPYVKIIQERHKNDRQKMNEEMLELYKKHKVNPLGGCLPMLLQIPVFIALYHALFFSIELRGAPFLGWVDDLSVADPYYVWPVLMGASMFLQQRLNPSVGDPTQQKIMMMLPIVFTFLFMSFPAGLVLYWTVNNVLTIAQQFYIYKFAKD